MVELVLWDKTKIGKTISFIVKSVYFYTVAKQVIIFVNFNKLPQHLINYVQKHNVDIMTWFGEDVVRLCISVDLIDEIKSYDGNIPHYVY